MNDEIIELFRSWMIESLANVEFEYFKYGERTFCYELYSLIRACMNSYQSNNPEMNIEHLYFHAELMKKSLNDEEIAELNLQNLDGIRYPDFLLHNENNSNHQLIAVEVKTNNLDKDNFLYDLRKLYQFANNYEYQRTIFLINNYEQEYIQRLFNQINNNNNLNQINFDTEIWLVNYGQAPIIHTVDEYMNNLI